MGIIDDFGLLEEQVKKVTAAQDKVAKLTAQMKTEEDALKAATEKKLADLRTQLQQAQTALHGLANDARETHERITVTLGTILPASTARVRVA